MEQLPILYKRAKTGAIQQWRVFTAFREDWGAQIIKEAGQLGGKQTRHIEEINSGVNIGKANETTPIQQAENQAVSDWKAKKDSGYKSLEELGIIQCDGYVTKDGQDLSLEEMLEVQLPQFNSGVGGIPMPMLAKAVDWKKVTYPCYVQPKLDGVRCLLVVEPRRDGDLSIRFLSRKGKQYTTLDHIAVDVAKLDPKEPFILDGEIYSEDLTFQQITAAVKKQRPESLKLKFRCYDIVDDRDQVDRALSARSKVEAIGSHYISWVETGIANSKQDVLDCHNQWVQQGYEGAMIRLYDGYYGQGQRSSHLLKVKEFITDEFKLKDFEFGQRGVEDLIAICETSNGVEFKAKMQGTKASKEELSAWWCATGRHEEHVLTVKYFGITDEGSIRFPVGVGVRDYE